jgi:hypothetical protein
MRSGTGDGQWRRLRWRVAMGQVGKGDVRGLRALLGEAAVLHRRFELFQQALERVRGLEREARLRSLSVRSFLRRRISFGVTSTSSSSSMKSSACSSDT